MKKFIIFLLIAVVTAGAAFADPVGLKVYIDGFSFGDAAAEEYKFSGEGGSASITPGIAYSASFLDGSLALVASVQDTIGFDDPTSQDLRLNLNAGYNLQLAAATKLVFSVWDFFHLIGANEKFADTDQGQVKTRIGAGAQFYQTLDFGVVWAILDVEFHKSFAEGSELGISTGKDNGFSVGVNSNFGLYGLAGFAIAFNDAAAREWFMETTGLSGTKLRIGYKISNIDGRVTVEIPLMEDGLRYKGINIIPRFTYSNIIPGLEAYLNLAIDGIAADADVGRDVGFTPAVGVSYSF
jgi:hypothetical protein